MMSGYYPWGAWFMMGVPMFIGYVIVIIILWKMMMAQEKIAALLEQGSRVKQQKEDQD